MADNPYGLSAKDIQDLQLIHAHMSADDPRRVKISTLLAGNGQQSPDYRAAALQATRNMAAQAPALDRFESNNGGAAGVLATDTNPLVKFGADAIDAEQRVGNSLKSTLSGGPKYSSGPRVALRNSQQYGQQQLDNMAQMGPINQAKGFIGDNPGTTLTNTANMALTGRVLGKMAPAAVSEVKAPVTSTVELLKMTPEQAQLTFDTIRKAAAEKLRTSAAEQYNKVLNPTTRQNKMLSKEKVVPGLLERDVVTSSPKKLAEKAAAQKAAAGDAVNTIWESLPKDASIESKPLIDGLEKFKDEFRNEVPISENEARVMADAGKASEVRVQLDEQGKPSFSKLVAIDDSIGAIQKLQDMIAEHGDRIPAKAVLKIRQLFDKKVSRAGGYQGVSLAEGSAVDAAKELAGLAREEISKLDPNMKAANAEYSFWSNVQRVADATALRRTGQQGGLRKLAFKSAGAIAGSAIKPGLGTVGGLEAGAALAAVEGSPFINTAIAVGKNKLANVIEPGAKAAPKPASIPLSQLLKMSPQKAKEMMSKAAK